MFKTDDKFTLRTWTLKIYPLIRFGFDHGDIFWNMEFNYICVDYNHSFPFSFRWGYFSSYRRIPYIKTYNRKFFIGLKERKTQHVDCKTNNTVPDNNAAAFYLYPHVIHFLTSPSHKIHFLSLSSHLNRYMYFIIKLTCIFVSRF